MRKRCIRCILIVLCVLVSAFFTLWFLRPPQGTGVTAWGVTFSHVFAEHLGLPWQDVYGAILNDLRVRDIRIPIYWPEIEKTRDTFEWDDYDWMLDEAAKRDARITLVLGMRVPRWPECHLPEWAKMLPREERNMALRNAITETVERYKRNATVTRWQVENEPFLPYFGECPPPDADALDAEIALVKFLDPSRPIVVTDSGELSIWASAYTRADVFGTTMYRSVWSDILSPTFGYITYPLPPRFFWFKTNVMRALYGNKPVIVSELQAEPWGPEFFRIAKMTPSERAFTMSIGHFRDNIAYARAAGFPEVYFWGVEWWYMLQSKEKDSSYWNLARETIQNTQ